MATPEEDLAAQHEAVAAQVVAARDQATADPSDTQAKANLDRASRALNELRTNWRLIGQVAGVRKPDVKGIVHVGVVNEDGSTA